MTKLKKKILTLKDGLTVMFKETNKTYINFTLLI